MNPHDHAIIVSADTHVGPRIVEDLRPYCPSKYHDEFDRFAAANNLGGLTESMLGNHPNTRTLGHYNSAARLADYDYDGVAAGVMFHGSQSFEPIPFVSPMASDDGDAELKAVGLEIFNRWLADFVAEAP